MSGPSDDQDSERPVIPATDPSPNPTVPRRLDLALLAERYGVSERWWRRHLPKMIEAGVVRRRGRLVFGRLMDVDTWLTR